jgi:hypothetical protein
MQRCLAMTDAAASQSGLTRDDVRATVIVPDPPPKDGVLVTLGGAAPINVRITLTDGTIRDAPMCGGLASGPACTDAPRLEARSGLSEGAGYKDVPCADDAPPNTCGRPLPTFEPAAVAAARPLSIPTSGIPIDHVGAYEVSLGNASIPNGVVSVASFAFADTWPADVSLEGGTANIELRSLEPGGKPFQNYYEHGWRPGVERVDVVLAFRVLWFRKGAVRVRAAATTSSDASPSFAWSSAAASSGSATAMTRWSMPSSIDQGCGTIGEPREATDGPIR